jgi:Tfp pilus assembly protein PilN
VKAVNLIPADQRAGAGGIYGRSNGGAIAVLAMVGGLAVLALLYGLADRQVTSRRAQAASLNARAQRAQAAAAGLAPYTSFIALREERQRAVSQLVDARFDWAHAFHELGRVLPHSASISSIEGTVGSASAGGSTGSTTASTGAAGTASATGGTKASGSAASSAVSATPPGSVPTITLNGCATSQADVARTLNRLRLIDGVSEVTLQSSTKADTGTAATAGSGQCPPHAPAFTILLTFDPLPATIPTGTASAVTAVSTGGSR